MQDNYTTKGKHLTIDSRRLIERWKKKGKSNREIASLLGKVPPYENNRKRSVKKSSLTKELKEKILHYHNQKF
ncbi:helix-turn-helix domain-containing protein, partial [Streptococcus pneumoniae]|uniref:helix-turn-helix domain-containing protein n=1 Tax=Streptococcus pneumoniae TaxID=1313 RepID=UPI000B057121